MLALLGVCFLNSYSEARGVWDETDERNLKIKRMIIFKNGLKKIKRTKALLIESFKQHG